MRVGVLGATGRMGTTVCAALLASEDFELACAIGRRAVGQRLASVAPALSESELVIAGELDALLASEVEAVVDFTVADAAQQNLRWCAEHHLHAVCGATGLSEAQLAELAEAFAPAERPNAIVAPNFALGAVILMRLCELVAPYLEGVEIIELHHPQKRDAPSGTALETARRIAAARAAAGSPPLTADPTSEMVLPGARGGVTADGIHLHSVRLPGLLAHEEVLFGGAGQSLSIRHDAFDRVSFMPGVLLALRCVASRPGLTVGLDALLDL